MDNIGKNTPLISIILPVYGVENYICKCLESLINQTYCNIEILCVDDGTKDKSSIICEEYALKDSRIKVFHKKNGGLSDARNYGIERANGEYLTFVDSDDYVDSDYVEYLYTLLENGKYKLSLCTLHVVFTSNGHMLNHGSGKKVVLDTQKCLEMMCYHDEVDTCAYAKLYHKSIFDNVRYPKGKLFEDIGTTYLTFDQCDYISCGFEPKYYYVIRDNSIVTSSFNEKKLDMLEMTDKMADYVEQKYPQLKSATLRRRGYARFSTLNQMLDVKDKKYRNIRSDIIGYLKRISSAIMKNPKTPKRDKIAYLCLKCGYPVYKLFWKLYIKKQRG